MIASKRSIQMNMEKYIKEIKISKRLEQKWGRPFPTSREILLEKNRKRKHRKTLKK